MLALLLGSGSAPRLRAVPAHFSLPRIASQTQQIISRNLFYGEQPGKAGAVSLKQANGPCLTATRRTSSSIALINTITLQNAKKSVAMLKVPSQAKLFGLRQGDQIPSIGVVGLIEDLRMIFLNSRTGQCEFVAGKKEPDIAPPQFSVLSKKAGKKIFDQRKAAQSINSDGNRFKIKRSYINENLENLSGILSQARAISIKRPDGTLAFKMTDVVPGGLFAKLGINNEDQIKAIDGKAIRSETQIFALFNSLKRVNNISITVLRNGGEQKLEYSFVD